MGSYGSGRRSPQGKKGKAEHRFSIDVRDWHRKGRFLCDQKFSFCWQESHICTVTVRANVFGSSVSLSISRSAVGADEPDIRQCISLVNTDCHLGGSRQWFKCPVRGCSKRVAILYYAGAFACRTCCNLAYESQGLPAAVRASRRLNRTRAKLGWKPGFLNGVEWKQKGMHWKTFAALIKQHEVEMSRTSLIILTELGVPVDVINKASKRPAD